MWKHFGFSFFHFFQPIFRSMQGSFYNEYHVSVYVPRSGQILALEIDLLHRPLFLFEILLGFQKNRFNRSEELDGRLPLLSRMRTGLLHSAERSLQLDACRFGVNAD